MVLLCFSPLTSPSEVLVLQWRGDGLFILRQTLTHYFFNLYPFIYIYAKVNIFLQIPPPEYVNIC